jgi:SPP1 family predicted phage head-tail adaptor
MTDPGQLNRRLVLEALVETADGAGGVTRGYEIVTTLWASLAPRAASDNVAADALGASISHRIVVRWRGDITLRHRFRDGARTFHIAAIRERDRRFLDIDAEERTD